jgi:hypothetical protein
VLTNAPQGLMASKGIGNANQVLPGVVLDIGHKSAKTVFASFV